MNAEKLQVLTKRLRFNTWMVGLGRQNLNSFLSKRKIDSEILFSNMQATTVSLRDINLDLAEITEELRKHDNWHNS